MMKCSAQKEDKYFELLNVWNIDENYVRNESKESIKLPLPNKSRKNQESYKDCEKVINLRDWRTLMLMLTSEINKG